MEKNFFVVVVILFIFSITGIFVYSIIMCSVRKNRRYEHFARDHGYQFDRAQGQLTYRESSHERTTKSLINLNIFRNPFVEKYANYLAYPFGRGANIKVAYVIYGIYNKIEFRAFTYIFTGNALENSGAGGVFSIVMIKREKEPSKDLPKNVFYEGMTLCNYVKGNLEVDTIHSRIEYLKKIC